MEDVQARGKKDKEERDHNVLGKIDSPAPSFIGMIPVTFPHVIAFGLGN